ncbi:MAG TPA: hypothetical protein DCW29_07980, partial [Janthinobacterium sp.]|nr:hypothetical protein [Janthinobacterium sp.]
MSGLNHLPAEYFHTDMRYRGFTASQSRKRPPARLPMIASALLQLFAAPPAPALLNHGKYAPALVGLSILVALFSSWMGCAWR